MTKAARLLVLFLLMCISITSFAQSVPTQTNEAKQAEMHEKIGLDISVPDYDTNIIDAKVMDSRIIAFSFRFSYSCWYVCFSGIGDDY